MLALLSSLSRSSPIAWSQKSAEPTRSGFNSRTLKVQSICEVVLKVSARLRLRWHCVKLTLFLPWRQCMAKCLKPVVAQTTSNLQRKPAQLPQERNVAHLQKSCPTPFSLSCDSWLAREATIRNQKVWTVFRPLHITVTTSTHLPTNRQTCSQRSQWRRAIALALERRG